MQVLADVSHGKTTEHVRNFIVQAYVRGAACGSADRSEFEHPTAVFTKRRYRDSWNRNVVRRIGRTHNHTLKIKARVRAKGQRGTNWYGEKRVEYYRRKCRTSNLWLLQLSGDFHPAFETEPTADLQKHHMMRVRRPQLFRHGSTASKGASADTVAERHSTTLINIAL